MNLSYPRNFFWDWICRNCSWVGEGYYWLWNQLQFSWVICRFSHFDVNFSMYILGWWCSTHMEVNRWNLQNNELDIPISHGLIVNGWDHQYEITNTPILPTIVYGGSIGILLNSFHHNYLKVVFSVCYVDSYCQVWEDHNMCVKGWNNYFCWWQRLLCDLANMFLMMNVTINIFHVS